MEPAGTRIQLCGHLRVEVAGRASDEALRGRQGRLGFAYLVLHRHRPVRRDELTEALWPTGAAPPSDSALAPVLSRLRRALEPATLDGRDGLVLGLPTPVWVDVEEAALAIARAREEVSGGDARAALDAAHTAARLVEGGLLPGHDAEWLEAPRAALADLRVEALELAARAGTRLGDAALGQAELDARAAVAAAPFRESARAALIDVLRARGNVAEAVRAFEDVRLLLREELGTVPGPELMALHERLLGLDAPPPPRPRPAAAPAPEGAADLVEREAELDAVDEALARLFGGRGGVVVLEGPAGIGKTRLLVELRDRALAGGARVLEARAGVLERDFGFGIARQLLAGAATAHPEALAGAAAPARAAVADVAGGTDGSFAVLDGLFHLTAALAGDGPLVLAVDDLQWSDPASLRFVAYLARRIAALPVLVAATARTGEPGVEEALLAELAQDPAATALRPAPLTAAATHALVRARLGDAAEEPFSAACHAVTSGNPLLVGQLLTALRAEHVPPDAAHAAQVRAVGPRAVSRTVLLRLARLPSPAVDVARAAAVLGEQPGLRALAALAGTDEAAAAGAVEVLARAEILRAEEPLGFVHPLVRDAVYFEVPAARRGLAHARAARLLAELGASPERVAAQLLLAPPAGDPWVVDRLREAADVAMRRGAPDAALSLLERAQAEPPPPDQRAALALELGGSAAYVRGPAGVEPLRSAYAGLTDPAERGRAAIRLSHLLLFVDSPEAGAALARRAEEELPAELDDLRQGLLANRLVGVGFGAADPEARELVRAGPRGTGPGARALGALAAMDVALEGGPAAEASALARAALAGPGLAAFEVTAPVALACTVLTLGDPSEGLAAVARYTEHAHRQGEVLGAIGADLWGGFAHVLAGDLPAAIASLERAQEGERLWGTKLDAVMGYSAALLALAWLERGELERARAALHSVEGVGGGSDGARFWLASEAELHLTAGRPGAAVALTERLEGLRPPGMHPVWAPWRGIRARALAALGRREEALALAADEVAVARAMAAPWVTGRVLRVLGKLEGSGGLDHLRQAVALLEPSSARLERAKAHAALAAAAAGDEAAVARATAHELAVSCGADALARALAPAVPAC